MREQQLQSKILKYLKANKYWVFKTIRCNINGVPDIIACDPGTGKLIGIEVKVGSNKPSELQKYQLAEIERCGGIGILAYSLEDVTDRLTT